MAPPGGRLEPSGHTHHADERVAVRIEQGEADDEALAGHEALGAVDGVEHPAALALAAWRLEATVHVGEEGVARVEAALALALGT